MYPPPGPPQTPTAYAPHAAPHGAPPWPGPSSGGDYRMPAWAPPAAELSQLAQDTRTWTIAAAIGWFVGFMWALGPIAWYQATRIRERYDALGVPPPQELKNLRLIGLITTVLSVVFAVFTALVVLAYVGFFLGYVRR